MLIEVAATDQSGAGIMDEKVLPPDELVDTRESITGLTIDDFAGAFLLVAAPFVLFAFCLVVLWLALLSSASSLPSVSCWFGGVVCVSREDDPISFVTTSDLRLKYRRRMTQSIPRSERNR